MKALTKGYGCFFAGNRGFVRKVCFVYRTGQYRQVKPGQDPGTGSCISVDWASLQAYRLTGLLLTVLVRLINLTKEYRDPFL